MSSRLDEVQFYQVQKKGRLKGKSLWIDFTQSIHVIKWRQKEREKQHYRTLFFEVKIPPKRHVNDTEYDWQQKLKEYNETLRN